MKFEWIKRMVDLSIYQSPFSWRYASPEMRSIWSEEHKRRLWRRIWIALARAQVNFGLVQINQVEELEKHVDQVDIPRALEIEADIRHDLMAELKTFAEQCPGAGGILHLGATSMDIEDNADAIRLRQSLSLTLNKLHELLEMMAGLIKRTAEQPIMAFTHLQPAEPSTLGYRFSSYAQDILQDWQNLSQTYQSIRGKGFKGSVGSAAAYIDLLGLENFSTFEKYLSEELDLPFYEVTTQTYPRKQDYELLCDLAGLGGSLYKFAFDLRLLQSPPIGELSEPFGAKQVGSSAMPFKRNPINAEKIDSLARQLAVLPQVAWNNASHSLLERTLDDSANRRSLLPESFLITDELLRTMLRVIKDLNIHTSAINHNLETYAPFAATERILMAASQNGADRQEFHEVLRSHALIAWQEVQAGRANPLIELLTADGTITRYVNANEITRLTTVETYTGIAAQRARWMAEHIHQVIGS